MMKAVVYEKFGHAPKVMNVKEPTLADDGVIVNVHATGVCRSDWHGWKG